MQILIPLLLPTMVASSDFIHMNQGENDITTINIPSNAYLIRLARNKLGESGIPATFFQDFTSLGKLELWDNHLNDSGIPDFWLSGRENTITYISLYDNLLTTIRKNQFIGLHRLDYLSVGKNQLISIESGIELYFTCDSFMILRFENAGCIYRLRYSAIPCVLSWLF